jgi:hypothetical protein
MGDIAKEWPTRSSTPIFRGNGLFRKAAIQFHR